MRRIPAGPVVVPEDDRRDILQSIDAVLESGQLTLGSHGEAFEAEFARLVGVRHAVAVNSGTSALEIALRALGAEGREVVVPTNTFFATPAAVLHAGGRVRFADVDPRTLMLDLPQLEDALTPETAGVIVVHIGGMIAPAVEAIGELCRARGLWLLEDAAHAHGSSHQGQQAGSFGVAGAFSFYPTKVMTSGEGGMIVTDDRRLYEEALIYRDQGKAGFHANVHTRLGYNWRMSELHAIVGASQLRRLPEFIEARRRVAQAYDKALAKSSWFEPLVEPVGARSNYYKYVVLLRQPTDRAALKRDVRERFGVGLAGEVYELPCHRQPIFEGVSDRPLSGAEGACASHVCLPISARMTPEDAAYVAESMESAMEQLVGTAS